MASQNPAPQRQRVLTYTTPDTRDTLFYEERRTHIPRNDTTQASISIGDPHPDSVKFPNHVLVHIEPGDENGNTEKWWYAATREAQDAYNAEVTYPYAGLETCPRYSRVFVYRRDEYTPLPKGTPDTVHTDALLVYERQQRLPQPLDGMFIAVTRVFDTVPSMDQQSASNYSIDYPYNGDRNYPRYTRRYVVKRDEYSPVAATAVDPTNSEAVIVSEKVDEINDELGDSLYILVTQLYDKIPDITDPTDATAMAGYGYKVDYPFGGDSYPQVTWTFPVKLSEFNPETTYTTSPITGYTGTELVDQQVDPSPSDTTLGKVTRVYRTLPGPELETERTFTTERDIPLKFVLTGTEIQVQQQVKAGTAPEALGTDYSETQVKDDNDVLAVAARRSLTLNFADLEGYEVGMDTGAGYVVTQSLVPAGTAGSGVDANGLYSEVVPLNPYWSVKTTKKSTDLAGNLQSWDEIINYYWPPVLQSITFSVLNHRAGYPLRYKIKHDLKGPYNGPTRATVEETWSATPVAPPPVYAMLPEELFFDLILVRHRIPPCLHSYFYVYETTGTTHPEYPYLVATDHFPATNFVDWPNSLVVAFRQSPYRGGYRSRKTTVYKPT